jgi:hypothetical protein
VLTTERQILGYFNDFQRLKVFLRVNILNSCLLLSCILQCFNFGKNLWPVIHEIIVEGCDSSTVYALTRDASVLKLKDSCFHQCLFFSEQ